MKRSILFLAFTVLLNALLFAQNSSLKIELSEKDSVKIDQLKNALLKVSKKKKFDIYYQLAKLYVGHNDSIANNYAEKSLLESKTSQNEGQLAKSYYIIGKASMSTSNAKALDYYKLASTLFEKTNDSLLKDIYFDQANIHLIFSEFPEALNFALKSLEFNKINDIQDNILRDMSFIGYIHDRMYEFRESIKWNREALKLAKQLSDKKGESLCLGRIGIAYDELAEKDNFNLKLFDSALYYNQKSAKLSLQNNDLSLLRRTYSNIGNTYSKLKDYKKAEEFTLKSLAVPGFMENKGVTLVNLGKIYLETNRYQEAKKVLDSAMQNTIVYGTRKYQLEAFYRFHELDVKKGDYKNALKNYIQYKSIEDSLLNETKTKQIAEISERFKTADKEREILIQRANLAERDLTIQKQNYQLYSFIGLAFILGIIGYLLYNQQKLKNRQLQKENELKDALVKIETQNRLQEQRLRISRDLHDNIGAQLTFIISSLDNLNYGFSLPEKLGNKLKNISEFTTTTIYELRDTIWAMNKNEITLEDLMMRISNFIDKANKASEQVNFNFYTDKNLPIELIFTSVKGMNIYRIIQEAINNALKYAKASTIEVEFKNHKGNLQITISDDGIGFDKQTISYGNGLNNMKKRAHDIEAELSVFSEMEKGTTIHLQVSIK